MAGHSKWANTKHRKARIDAKRGKIFSKIAKEITVVARQGGGDPVANITLRSLIQKAKGVNMPNDNIDRAIKKGTGELEGAALEEILYEGYAPGGVAVLVQVLTDNKNRSVSEVRNVFTKAGGSMAGLGAVAHLFQRKGQIMVPADAISEDDLLMLVLEAGAENLRNDDEFFEVLTDVQAYLAVVEALEKASVSIDNCELTYLPDLEVPIETEKDAAAMMRFIDAMEDLEDVQNVYANFTMDDALLEAVTAE